MFTVKYMPGELVPPGTTKYFIMKYGNVLKKINIEYTHFPTLEDPQEYYIRAT